MTRYSKGSDTSRAAAWRISGQVSNLQKRVLDALASAGSGGLTDEEIGLACQLGGNTVRPRRNELRAKGLVLKTKLRRKLRSTGNSATVWVHHAYRDGALVDEPEPDPRDDAPPISGAVAMCRDALFRLARQAEVDAETLHLSAGKEDFDPIEFGAIAHRLTELTNKVSRMVMEAWRQRNDGE